MVGEWVTHQFYVSTGQISNCLERCVRAHIIMMKNDLVSPVVSSYFSRHFWQTNGCVPDRINHSVILKGTVCTACQFSPKNERPFSSKNFLNKQLLSDLAHLGTSTQSNAVCFWDHTHTSKICHPCRIYI